VCCVLLTKGDIHRVNRHCQFTFQTVPIGRVVLQDDASIESCELDTMLKLNSGWRTELRHNYHPPT
jgi:hypothetical protein